MEVKLAHDTIDKDELSRLCDWIMTGAKLTKGEQTLKLEADFAAYQGSKHCLYVNSGSSANLVMAYGLLRLGRLRNKKVIVPAVSWVTTVSPFMQLGFEVHMCDCNLDNLGVDLKQFEELCERERPAVAILVHVLGHANDLTEIKRICEKYDVTLLEDACEALGSELSGKKLGSHGLAGSFSLYYGHHISTIEGGFVVTDDDDLYETMMSIRSHGWSRDLKKNVQEALQLEHEVDDFRNLYTFYHPGFNLRATDLQAFIGQSQVKKLPGIVSIRQQNFELYAGLLDGYFQQTSDANVLSAFAYGTLVENPLEVSKFLAKHGVECRPLICGNIARHPFWEKTPNDINLVNANIVHDFGMYLPIHANMGADEINYVAELFCAKATPFQLREK